MNDFTFDPSAPPFASGSQGAASRGGRNRGRGRGNPRPQDGSVHQHNAPQPGDGAFLAAQAPNTGSQAPARNARRSGPRRDGPIDPFSQSNEQKQNPRSRNRGRRPENELPAGGDHQRAGIAGQVDGSVGGVIRQGEVAVPQSSVEQPSEGQTAGHERTARNRNRNSRNKKLSGVEGSAPPASSNDQGVSSETPRQPKRNPRERQSQANRSGNKHPVNARRAAFGGKLSSYANKGQNQSHHGDAENQFEEAQDRAMMGYSSLDRRNVFGMTKEADDLASKLIRGLTMRPFLECPICFSDLLPSQAIWSCLPTYSSVNATSADTTCCYTPFHLSCMQDWSSRSLKETRERARDRPAGDQSPITWRCPGCQKHRESTVTNYQCFCGRIKHLKATEDNRGSGSIAVPHSCGQSCSRKRSYCDHPCPLPCHPGPCPPCNISLVIPCASHEHPLAVKCSTVRGVNASAPTCDEVCNRIQNCGHPDHRCLEPCHEGPCQDCKVQEQVSCFCGKEEKSVKCGWKKADEVECGVRDDDGERTWRARFGCGRECGRLYDCGEHSCQEVCLVSAFSRHSTDSLVQPCHPHSIAPLPCPRSPDFVTHCPCGQTPLVDFMVKPRQKCTDPIPTCGKPCPSPQSGCDHPCGRKCHEGDCPPCEASVIAVCRCGESKITMKCWERKEMDETGEMVLCDRICHALRSCGRHECSRICCPLAYKAKNKGKKREFTLVEEDEGGLHTCPLVCGKLLSCGIHTCPQLDHKGPCGRCLEASYDELACACGRTVMQPPIRW